MVPQTVGGKMVGIVCALSGILVISLPIPVFVRNFDMLWNEHLEREKLKERLKPKKSMEASDIETGAKARKITQKKRSQVCEPRTFCW